MTTRLILLGLLVAGLLAPATYAQQPVQICVQQPTGRCSPTSPQIGTLGTLVAAKVLATGSGVLEGYQIGIQGATASTDYYVMLFDLAAVPTSGTTQAPFRTVPVETDATGNAVVAAAWQPGAFKTFSKGLVIGLSSTASPTWTSGGSFADIEADVQQ